MSVSLVLAFDRYTFSKGPIFCYERHRLDWYDYKVFDQISDEATPLAEGVMWYEDEGVELRKEDPYGDPLKFMSAHSLIRYLNKAPLSGWDLATLAFLKALPPEARVVLWWS